MQLRKSADRYGAVPQSLHWITVILVLIAWALGVFEDALPKGEARAIGTFYSHNHRRRDPGRAGGARTVARG